jgi:hypothetical protein
MPRESVGLKRSPTHVKYGATTLLLKLATNGATRSKVNSEGVLDFLLVEIWDGTVEEIAFKGALDVFLGSALW